MTAERENAANVLGHKPEVEVVDVPLKEVPASLSVSPVSISIYEFPVVKP
jgi:hypothetical protein